MGLGFGLAMVFGGTVGVGILRLPGTLAQALGDSRLIVLFWILGGVYALLGAMAVAELARERRALGAAEFKPHLEIYTNAVLLQLGAGDPAKIQVEKVR